MIANDFASCLEMLVTKIDLPSEHEHARQATYFQKLRCQEAIEHLAEAQVESETDNTDAAWVSLVKAAEVIGYMHGLHDASKLKTPEHGIKKLLRSNGGKGGEAKGRNGDEKRNEVIKALLAAAPSGGWPTKENFELQYHGIVKKVPGFRDTEYQRRKIMSSPDMKAVLPPPKKRRRW